jgi:hypothetical protein
VRRQAARRMWRQTSYPSRLSHVFAFCPNPSGQQDLPRGDFALPSPQLSIYVFCPAWLVVDVLHRSGRVITRKTRAPWLQDFHSTFGERYFSISNSKCLSGSSDALPVFASS